MFAKSLATIPTQSTQPLTMNIAAPTFNALNKPQKRALILRDQLRFIDPQHLNGFLEGVSKDEPPTYKKVDGVIQPELTLVTLKAEATHFDLGNVLLAEEKNAIYRVHLVVENGHIDMRAEDPLPQDDDVLDSVPIHGFIAKGMVPLFRDKFHAIYSRINKINGARQAAYKMANQAPTLVHDGEVCHNGLIFIALTYGRLFGHIGERSLTVLRLSQGLILPSVSKASQLHSVSISSLHPIPRLTNNSKSEWIIPGQAAYFKQAQAHRS